MYVTTLPVVIVTGSFLCLYDTTVPVFSPDASILGILDSFADNTFPSTFVMYFLKAKSNSLVSGALSINIIGCVFCSVAFAYKVTFVLETAVPFSYAVAFALAVVIK